MARKRNIGATLTLKDGNFFTGLKSASSATNSFKSKLTSATSGLKSHSSQLAATGNSLKSLATKVVGVVAAYASISAIKNWGSACLEAANNATEANVRLNTIMAQIPGNTQAMTDAVAAYSKELSKNTTIGGTAQKMGASQLASFQMSAESIKKLMPQLDNLAVAQYGVNVSSDQMVQAANMLGKAYAGQTGAMTRAGIVMTDAQAKLIKTGDEATKTATLVEVLQQNFGNLAQEMAKTPEGALLRVKNQIGALKVAVGQQLQPIVTTALNYAADNIPKIESAVSHILEAAQPVFDWITGTAIPKVGGAVNGVVDTVKGIYDAVSPSLGNLKDAFVNIRDALGEAFSGSSVDGVTSLASGALSTVINALATVGNMIAGVIDHWDTFKPIIEGVVGAITAYKVITGIASAATTVMSAAQAVLNGVLMANPIGFVVLAVAGLVGAFVWAWNKFEGFRNFWKGLWEGIKNVVSSAVEKVKAVVDVLKNTFSSVKDKLSGLWNGIKEGASKGMGALKQTVGDSLNSIKSAYEKHGGGIKGIAAGAIEGVKQYYLAGYNYLNNLTGGKLGEMLSGAGEKMSAVKDAMGAKWDEIKGGAVEKWTAITSSVKSFASSIHDGLVSKFTAVKDGILGIWNGIVSGIKGSINRIISAVNTMIGGVNKISFAAPDWVPVIGGKKWGVNIPKIPMLANGGVIRQPGSVIVGERGPETLTLPKGASVTPLDKGKRSENINHFDIDININGVDKPLDEAFNEALERFVGRLQLQLANL